MKNLLLLLIALLFATSIFAQNRIYNSVQKEQIYNRNTNIISGLRLYKYTNHSIIGNAVVELTLNTDSAKVSFYIDGAMLYVLSKDYCNSNPNVEWEEYLWSDRYDYLFTYNEGNCNMYFISLLNKEQYELFVLCANFMSTQLLLHRKLADYRANK